MRCDEIQEKLVELLYAEKGSPAASPGLRAHLKSCARCQNELNELQEVQSALRSWRDETPRRPVNIPAQISSPASSGGGSRPGAFSVAHAVRYGLIAASLLLAFLVIRNAELRWDQEGFMVRTHVFSAPGETQRSKYYTKEEVRSLLIRALDESEMQTMETNRLMIQQMLDFIESDMDAYLRTAHFSAATTRN